MYYASGTLSIEKHSCKNLTRVFLISYVGNDRLSDHRFVNIKTALQGICDNL